MLLASLDDHARPQPLHWSPRDLDDVDALLLALTLKIRNAKRG